ncbi:MAG: hypothetical protein U9Q07_02390, partial [Planctomycetota bacterium]|nr:hypothetical protein [Planctomycetota bacterium]
MNEKIHDHSERSKRRKNPVLWIYLLIGFVAAVAVSSMGYILYVGNHMVAEHAPLIDAALKIEIEATTSHLLLEEVISGDRHASIDDVLVPIDKADWYVQAMLEGGESTDGKFVSSKDPHLRQEIAGMRSTLAEFRRITLQRWEAKNTGNRSRGKYADSEPLWAIEPTISQKTHQKSLCSTRKTALMSHE